MRQNFREYAGAVSGNTEEIHNAMKGGPVKMKTEKCSGCGEEAPVMEVSYAEEEPAGSIDPVNTAMGLAPSQTVGLVCCTKCGKVTAVEINQE